METTGMMFNTVTVRFMRGFNFRHDNYSNKWKQLA